MEQASLPAGEVIASWALRISACELLHDEATSAWPLVDKTIKSWQSIGRTAQARSVQRTRAPIRKPQRSNKAEVQDEAPFRVGFLVHDVSRLRRTLFDQALKPHGITRSQWWVLANLSRRGSEAGVVPSDLAKRLDVGKVTLARLLDRLESRGDRTRRTVVRPESSSPTRDGRRPR
jgi:hypothetical protein